MVDNVDMKASRRDLKPQIGQFGRLESFFSTYLLFYFSTGGKMVEQVDLNLSRYELEPKIGQFGHLEPFFPTFLLYTERWG